MIDTSFWDHVGPDFLADDRAHPSRAIAGGLVAVAMEDYLAEHRMFVMAEIGPGPGFDYADYFSKLEGLEYVAYEASAKMGQSLAVARPEIRVEWGSFGALGGKIGGFSLAYTRATLEHQPDFVDGLRCMIRSAYLVIVTWFLPPSERDEIVFREDTGVHNNRYARARVITEIEKEGGKLLAEIPVPWALGNDNAIWVIRGSR